MTNEIEKTKRLMFSWLAQVKMVDQGGTYQIGSATHLELALESHLEAMAQDRGRLVEERDALRNRVQVLESANKIAGERLQALTEGRKTPSSTSDHETTKNASCAPLDAKTAAILGAVVDVQRIVTDWATKGLKAKEAMRLVAGVVNGGPCYSAMLSFERKGGVQLSEDDHEKISEAMAEVVNHVMRIDGFGCQHEFHPKFPAGEMCTYCGVAK